MKDVTWRLAALGACALLAAAPAPAGVLDDLGVDLGKIFGSGGKGDAFSLAEQILESELPKRVGPASRYEVKLDRNGSSLFQGRFSGVDVTGIDVKTADGLVIPRMDLHLKDLKLGLGSRKIESVGDSSFALQLGQEAVSQYVRKRAGADVRDLKLGFRNGRIVVNATPELLGFGLPSEVVGRPVVQRGKQVNFKADKVAVFGISLPQMATRELEKKVNPVVDLTRLKLPVRITDLRLRGSQLVAEGAADFGLD